MKKYRRIEITAFRRRITIVSGEPSAETQENEGVRLNNVDTQEVITPESAEGQHILVEAVRLLEEKLVNQAREDF